MDTPLDLSANSPFENLSLESPLIHPSHTPTSPSTVPTRHSSNSPHRAPYFPAATLTARNPAPNPVRLTRPATQDRNLPTLFPFPQTTSALTRTSTSLAAHTLSSTQTRQHRPPSDPGPTPPSTERIENICKTVKYTPPKTSLVRIRVQPDEVPAYSLAYNPPVFR